MAYGLNKGAYFAVFLRALLLDIPNLNLYIMTKGGPFMISVTRLNNQDLVINADLIELVESTPDTIISLTTGKKIMVLESVEGVVDKVMDYRRQSFPSVREIADKSYR